MTSGNHQKVKKNRRKYAGGGNEPEKKTKMLSLLVLSMTRPEPFPATPDHHSSVKNSARSCNKILLHLQRCQREHGA
jgi:hypothetical protein